MSPPPFWDKDNWFAKIWPSAGPCDMYTLWMFLPFSCLFSFFLINWLSLFVDRQHYIELFIAGKVIIHTLCCICLCRCCFELETRIIIKISTHPCYQRNFDWLWWDRAKKILWKDFKMADSKKLNFKNPPILNIFFKNFRDWSWVSRINWCKGYQFCSTYMVIRLSNLRWKKGLKTLKKHF